MAKTFSKIIKIMKKPLLIIPKLSQLELLNWLNDDIYLKILYWILIEKNLNIENPRSFNEKVQWLKLHDRRPEYTTMVDKYEVKKYVASVIGEDYIIPTLGIWNHFDEIDFEELPKQFVLKCTHDSGGLVIVRDKNAFDMKAAKKKLEANLKRNFYWLGREWPYKNVKPRIIAEKYMEEKGHAVIDGSVDTLQTHEDKELTDYKFMCFHGEVKCIFTCTERYSGEGLKVTFFDKDWNRFPFERHYPKSNKEIPKPGNLYDMIKLSEQLAKGVPFVRVDFYNIDQKIYFGELTFYPGSGFEEFNPEEWDDILGEWLVLPKVI